MTAVPFKANANVAITSQRSRSGCRVVSKWDRRKFWGQAAIAVGGHGSLVGRNLCPQPKPRSPGLSISMTSVACPSPSASIFTNLKTEATRPVPVKEPARKYPVDAYTPKLAAVALRDVVATPGVGLDGPAGIRDQNRSAPSTPCPAPNT